VEVSLVKADEDADPNDGTVGVLAHVEDSDDDAIVSYQRLKS
jgi:hypothetical protein